MFDPSGDEARYAPAEQVQQEGRILTSRSIAAHEQDGVAQHQVVYLGWPSGLADQVNDIRLRLDET